MTSPHGNATAVCRPRFLTFLAALSNLLGVVTVAAALAWAISEREIYLTANEARLGGLIAACGVVGIIASNGLFRLRSDAIAATDSLFHLAGGVGARRSSRVATGRGNDTGRDPGGGVGRLPLARIGQ